MYHGSLVVDAHARIPPVSTSICPSRILPSIGNQCCTASSASRHIPTIAMKLMSRYHGRASLGVGPVRMTSVNSTPRTIHGVRPPAGMRAAMKYEPAMNSHRIGTAGARPSAEVPSAVQTSNAAANIHQVGWKWLASRFTAAPVRFRTVRG